MLNLWWFPGKVVPKDSENKKIKEDDENDRANNKNKFKQPRDHGDSQ